MNVILEKQFRELVAAELKEQQISRTQLARRMGITPQQVTNYLNGHHHPTIDMMERFLGAVGIEPELRVGKRKTPTEVPA